MFSVDNGLHFTTLYIPWDKAGSFDFNLHPICNHCYSIIHRSEGWLRDSYPDNVQCCEQFWKKNYCPVELSTTLFHHNYYICNITYDIVCFYSGLGRDLLMYMCMSNQNDLQDLISYVYPSLLPLSYNWYRHQQSPCTCTQATAGFLLSSSFQPGTSNYFQLREASCFKHLELNIGSFLIQTK